MADKAKSDKAKRISITLPRRLVGRIDGMAEQMRKDNPYRTVTRSGVICHMLAEALKKRDA